MWSLRRREQPYHDGSAACWPINHVTSRQRSHRPNFLLTWSQSPVVCNMRFFLILARLADGYSYVGFSFSGLFWLFVVCVFSEYVPMLSWSYAKPLASPEVEGTWQRLRLLVALVFLTQYTRHSPLVLVQRWSIELLATTVGGGDATPCEDTREDLGPSF